MGEGPCRGRLGWMWDRGRGSAWVSQLRAALSCAAVGGGGRGGKAWGRALERLMGCWDDGDTSPDWETADAAVNGHLVDNIWMVNIGLTSRASSKKRQRPSGAEIDECKNTRI